MSLAGVDWARVQAYYRKATALESLLRYQEAHATYQAGLKVDPNDQ